MLVVKPWFSSFTPAEFCDELEKSAYVNHQQFHQGLSWNLPSKGGNAGKANNTQLKDCAICLSFGHTNPAKSHSTENHWWNNTDTETVAEEASKDLPKSSVDKVDENRQTTPSRKGKGSNGQEISGGKGNRGQSRQGHSSEIFETHQTHCWGYFLRTKPSNEDYFFERRKFLNCSNAFGVAVLLQTM